MKKYNLEDFLDWCKDNTRYKKYDKIKTLNYLREFYDFRTKNPLKSIYIESGPENIGIISPHYIVNSIINYISNIRFYF